MSVHLVHRCSRAQKHIVWFWVSVYIHLVSKRPKSTAKEKYSIPEIRKYQQQLRWLSLLFQSPVQDTGKKVSNNSSSKNRPLTSCPHLYLVHPLVPCAPTRTLRTRLYLAHPLVPCTPRLGPCTPTRTLYPRLVPCAPTRTLCTHSYLVHRLVPCATRCQTRAKEDQHSTQKCFPGGNAGCVSCWSWQCGWQVCSHHHPSHEQQLQNRTPRNIDGTPWKHILVCPVLQTDLLLLAW